MSEGQLTIAEQVDLHFPGLREKSNRIKALKAKVESLRQARLEVIEKYKRMTQEDCARVSTDIRSVERKILLEETLIRRRIVRALEAGRDPSAVKHRKVKPTFITIQEKDPDENHTQ